MKKTNLYILGFNPKSESIRQAPLQIERTRKRVTLLEGCSKIYLRVKLTVASLNNISQLLLPFSQFSLEIQTTTSCMLVSLQESFIPTKILLNPSIFF